MKGFFKFIVLPLAVVALVANLKDIQRYIKMRNM